MYLFISIHIFNLFSIPYYKFSTLWKLWKGFVYHHSCYKSHRISHQKFKMDFFGIKQYSNIVWYAYVLVDSHTFQPIRHFVCDSWNCKSTHYYSKFDRKQLGWWTFAGSAFDLKRKILFTQSIRVLNLFYLFIINDNTCLQLKIPRTK